MPDDYPRDAWDAMANLGPQQEFADLVEEYGMEVPVGPSGSASIRQALQMRNPSAADIARKYGTHAPAKPHKGEGVKINRKIEMEHRKVIRQLVKVVSDADMLRLVEAHMQRGNLKVPEAFLIWNFTPAHQCPSLAFVDGVPSKKHSYCQAFNEDGRLVCYAWYSELGYKGCFPYRIRQNELWNLLLKHEPEIMIETIKRIHKRGLGKRGKPVLAVRWSEAGDVEDQATIDAVCQISKEITKLKVPETITIKLTSDHEIPHTRMLGANGKYVDGTGTIMEEGPYTFDWLPGKFVSYIYTARQDLVWSKAPRSGLTVMGSDWKGRGVSGTFKMVDKATDPPKQVGSRWGMCPMKCKICQRCPMGLDTRVLSH